jgi:sialic acid synthase SpsE
MGKERDSRASLGGLVGREGRCSKFAGSLAAKLASKNPGVTMHTQDRETIRAMHSKEESLYQLVRSGELSISNAQKLLERPNTFSTIVFSLPEMEVSAELLQLVDSLVLESMGAGQ